MEVKENEVSQEKLKSGKTQAGTYSHEEMVQSTLEKPKWLHFELSSLLQSFPIKAMSGLLHKGLAKEGLIAVKNSKDEAGPADWSIDKLSLDADGDKEIQADAQESIADCFVFDPDHESWQDLKEAFANDTLQMVSFSIEDKLWERSDTTQAAVMIDCYNGPYQTASMPGKLASLLFYRFKVCRKPLALLCLSEEGGAGQLLKEQMVAFGREWLKYGYVDSEFVGWLENEITYPETRVVAADHIFVQDDFPNGRPQLEETGVIVPTKEF
ncbi:MAG: hypothetical protein HUJ55_01640 [Ileibacterium sp.]|nr:hypothetical protein [Ileibacterium sp.]